MRRWVALMLLPTALFAEEAVLRLTLEDSIQRALQDNRELDAAALQLGVSRLGRDEAAAVFEWQVQPRVALERDEDRTTTRAGLAADRRTTFGSVLEAEVSALDRGTADDPRRGAEARVSIRQPLLRGSGRTYNRDGLLRAESAVRTARRGYEERRAALVLTVVEQHQQLAQLQQQEEDDARALERAARLLALTSARERQGRASRVDLLRVEAQHARAEASRSNTRDRRATLRREFAELLGLDLRAPIETLPAPALVLEDGFPALAESLAFSNRLDYAEARQAVSESERGLLVARERLWPTVDLLTGYGRSGSADRLAEAFALEEESWSVGIAGDTDLNRRADRSRVARAQLDAESATRALRTLEERIRREVQQALIAYDRARTQETFAERTLELARTRARLAQRMFETGRGDNFTATDAEGEWRSAQTARLSARTDSVLAAFRLKRVTGTLVDSPADLKSNAMPAVPEVAGP